LGDSIAAANGQQTQGVGPWSDADYRNGMDIESDNAALQRQTQPYYDQIVGAFGQPGDSNRYAGVQLAAASGYSGMGAVGIPRAQFGVFPMDEVAPRSNDGRGFIDEVRSATEGAINQGSAMGTPLPPSPYKWVSNEMVDGRVVSGHWADGVDTGDDSARLLARSKDSPAMQQWAQNYYSDGANSLNAAERADGFADNTSHSVRSDGSLLDMGRRLVQNIPLLVDVKNESAAPLRGYVNDMFALSNDPDASFMTRWAAQQSAASGINMLSEFESGFPTIRWVLLPRSSVAVR
jgi:hypothetical protein